MKTDKNSFTNNVDANSMLILSTKNGRLKILSTLQDAEKQIVKFAKLGFTNVNVDLESEVAGSIQAVLEERGFRVFRTDYATYTSIEVCW
jgi:hypothetical protein